MTLLELNVLGSLLIILTIVVRSLFLNRLSKQTFVILWDIIVLRLMIPFSVPLPHSVSPITTRIGIEHTELFLSRVRNLSPFHSVAGGERFVSVSEPVDSVVKVGSTISVSNIVWLVGFLLMASYFLISYLRHAKLFRQSLPCEDLKLIHKVNSFHLHRKVQVRVTDRFPSPLTYGIIHPVILIPRNFKQENEQDISYVLTHEYVHIRRFDAIRKLAYAVALCVHWFNPLVWCLFFLAGRDLEVSCDKEVISIVGLQKREAYAYALINMEEHKNYGFSLCNYFSKKPMEERIEAIMKFNKTSALAAVLSIVMVGGTLSAFAATPNAGESIVEEPMAAVANVNKNALVSIESSTVGTLSTRDEVVIEGEPGDVIAVGDLIFEIISQEEAEAITQAPTTRSSTVRWSTNLSGDSMSKSFEVTSSYPYAKVWISNTGSNGIKFTITKTTPTGSVVSGSSVTVAAGTSTNVYSTNKWSADTYYANFTSGKANMSGSAACRVASTIDELDI